MAASPAVDARAVPLLPPAPPRDRYWRHCQNSLGIARLLVQEGRPVALVSTACRMAVETACRAVLEHEGGIWRGDATAFLDRFGPQDDLWELEHAADPLDRLAAAERAVARIAAHMRRVAPERPWSY
jgi:hypothetical protein